MKQYLILSVLGLVLTGCEPTPTTNTQEATKPQQEKVETVAPEKTESPKPTNNETVDANQQADESKQKVVDYFKGDDEPNVKDAMWSASTLKLGMIGDGTKRDGFASYACDTAKMDFGIQPPFIVEIIDIQKLVANNQEVVLGKVDCL